MKRRIIKNEESYSDDPRAIIVRTIKRGKSGTKTRAARTGIFTTNKLHLITNLFIHNVWIHE